MINRAAIILRYKAPAIQWINDADPYEDDPGITAESVNRERTVYLISDEDAESDDSVADWNERNDANLFEMELEGWYNDPSLWPKDRSLGVFREWFDLECHTVLIDTVVGDIFDEAY